MLKKVIVVFLVQFTICVFGDQEFGDGELVGHEFNPDDYLTTPQIIRRHGYPAESHIVETSDGYLLTVHRIAGSKNGTKGTQPIILQHGLFSSSVDWLITGTKSLAFLLADKGYDVWLGNARGNFYSRAHISLNPNDSKFWNFSWHEMGTLDLPAVITHIANETGRGGDIIYVGHSMGTTMFFVFSSLMPEIAKQVKVMVALAPVAYMSHLKSPIRYLTPWINDIDFITKHLGVNEFLPSNKILKFLAFDCDYALPKRVCEETIFVLCGFDKQQMNDSLLPLIFSHDPAGTSTKTVLHYLQEIGNKGNFQKYDYGKEGNMKAYGQMTPPFYNVRKIEVPTYFMYADNDLLASPVDVNRLFLNMTNDHKIFEVKLPTFNHVDFLWAKDVVELVYEPLLKAVGNYTSFKNTL